MPYTYITSGAHMNPTDSFWEGVGESIGNSPGWMIIFGGLIVAIFIIVAKHIIPYRERIKMKTLELEEKQAANDAERIKVNTMLASQQSQTNLLIDGMRQSLDATTAHTDVLVAELRGARDRSRVMGEDMRHVRSTTDHTDDLVKEIHSIVVRKEGTD